ncbi:sulfonate ABC transporter substrate-binding protein [Yinghuangia aomiensis]|uniref:Sulfonate ABC transporter substrate-binding protein n=1 Tax=Yinghuangia aomiensis TaxID=676205 RepID=A0ABP9HDI1_9ACTN
MPTTKLRWFRRAGAAVAAAALAFTATACGGDSEAADNGGGQTVLKLIDPGNAGVLAYAKKTGVLDRELRKVNARVEWGGHYASFTAATEAIRAGAVNVQSGAISPALGYLSSTPDIKIFSFGDPVTDQRAGAGDGLVVKPDSPIKNVQDLVGKRVAVNRAGHGEYLLLLALEQAGVPVDKVERVYMQPDQAAGAFAAGKVDAWVAIVDAFPEALAQGARPIFRGRDLPSDDLNITVASNKVLAENPKAVQTYLKVVQDLTAELRANPEKFQNVFEDKGPRAASGARLQNNLETARYTNPPRLPKAEDNASIEKVAALFKKYNVLPNPVDPAAVVFDWSKVPA